MLWTMACLWSYLVRGLFLVGLAGFALIKADVEADLAVANEGFPE